MKHSSTLQFAVVIWLGLFLAGCAAFQPVPTATPTAPPTSTATPIPSITPTPTPVFPLPEGKIIFERTDGKRFAGTAYGQGETAIILANMTSGGPTKWSPFIDAFDRQKFTVITFSYLQADDVGAVREIKSVLKALRASGYKRVICIGASLGGIACSGIATEPEMIGIAVVASPNLVSALYEQPYPKLFIAGENDRWAPDMQKSYDLSDDPKSLVIYPGNGMHGSDLFYSADGDAFLKLLLDFVNNLP